MILKLFNGSKIKCQGCEDVIPPTAPTAEIRIKTSAGLVEMVVCNRCATLLDLSADILQNKGRGAKDGSV